MDPRRIRTWSASDYQRNENINLSSVWSWLNVLSDLHDYGNRSDFWFLRGVCVWKNNRNQTGWADYTASTFSLKTQSGRWCFADAAAKWWHKWLWLVICAKSESMWLKIIVFWWELMVPCESKSTPTASCVSDGFDYQQGLNQPSSASDAILFLFVSV